MVTPHILVHQIIQPGETRRLQVKLEPGCYRLRTQRPGVETLIEWQVPVNCLSIKFGATVNLAARLQDKSQGGDVVISEKLRRDPAVAHLLDTLAVNVTPFATSIQGFDEYFSLFRLVLPSKQ